MARVPAQLLNPLVLKLGRDTPILAVVSDIEERYSYLYRRRATGSQVAKPNSSRAAGAGGSSNTMLKLYTDDSPGLRVYVNFFSFDLSVSV